jgi:hypothetical protein
MISIATFSAIPDENLANRPEFGMADASRSSSDGYCVAT